MSTQIASNASPEQLEAARKARRESIRKLSEQVREQASAAREKTEEIAGNKRNLALAFGIDPNNAGTADELYQLFLGTVGWTKYLHQTVQELETLNRLLRTAETTVEIGKLQQEISEAERDRDEAIGQLKAVEKMVSPAFMLLVDIQATFEAGIRDAQSIYDLGAGGSDELDLAERISKEEARQHNDRRLEAIKADKRLNGRDGKYAWGLYNPASGRTDYFLVRWFDAKAEPQKAALATLFYAQFNGLTVLKARARNQRYRSIEQLRKKLTAGVTVEGIRSGAIGLAEGYVSEWDVPGRQPVSGPVFLEQEASEGGGFVLKVYVPERHPLDGTVFFLGLCGKDRKPRRFTHSGEGGFKKLALLDEVEEDGRDLKVKAAQAFLNKVVDDVSKRSQREEEQPSTAGQAAGDADEGERDGE
ncbi:MAG: hypothetical protein A2939_02755 [Parcubacteria group bacterium RIFCSPLOWO2_01_FULL_48_18]|nr:MAG: hypothetical protein A2939_02755 [Parcubacteria group bacterium RIFCSPLOWO2_01_FULL_48_18]OHB23006.1 MAG: hypothetical protein A3J67_03890 [Parcubacteria group bacterium RIFCSPHIGHO2_02_FULL_48_10b]